MLESRVGRSAALKRLTWRMTGRRRNTYLWVTSRQLGNGRRAIAERRRRRFSCPVRPDWYWPAGCTGESELTNEWFIENQVARHCDYVDNVRPLALRRVKIIAEHGNLVPV